MSIHTYHCKFRYCPFGRRSLTFFPIRINITSRNMNRCWRIQISWCGYIVIFCHSFRHSHFCLTWSTNTKYSSTLNISLHTFINIHVHINYTKEHFTFHEWVNQVTCAMQISDCLLNITQSGTRWILQRIWDALYNWTNYATLNFTKRIHIQETRQCNRLQFYFLSKQCLKITNLNYLTRLFLPFWIIPYMNNLP